MLRPNSITPRPRAMPPASNEELTGSMKRWDSAHSLVVSALRLLQYSAAWGPTMGVFSSQAGGEGGPWEIQYRVAAVSSLTLSASVAPMMTNGSRTTRIIPRDITSAASVRRLPRSLSSRR